MRDKLIRRIEAYQAQHQAYDASDPIRSLIDDGLQRAKLALEVHDHERSEIERMTRISDRKPD
jgi:hypothetical protein